MKQKDFLLILIPSFLMTLAWIAFNIYHHSVSSTISDPLNIQIIPISPDFDRGAVSKIKEREIIEPIYRLSEGPPQVLEKPASPSATPLPQNNPAVEVKP